MSEKNQVEKVILSPFERGFDKLGTKLMPIVPMGVTPNNITSIGFIAGLLSAVGFYLAGFDKRFFFLAAFCILIHLTADSLDGAIARGRDLKSERGYFYDQMSDIIVAVATFLAIGFSSYASLGIMVFPALLYPINMVVILHWINLKKKWPFPRFGPFEMHFCLIIIAIISFFMGNRMFDILGYNLGIFDIAVLIAVPFGYFEGFLSAVKLFKELDAPGKNKE
ncbi:MAG: CDP-alcohol phosphatidyltransferase family protein [Deltaproteobacteria bacterium]